MIHWQPGVSLEEVEKQVILAALRYHQGNRTHAALSLKIALRTMTNKIQKYVSDGVQVPPPPKGRADESAA